MMRRLFAMLQNMRIITVLNILYHISGSKNTKNMIYDRHFYLCLAVTFSLKEKKLPQKAAFKIILR